MSEIHYIVKKKFKYGNQWLLPGDEFIPNGGKFDKQLMNSPWIRREEVSGMAPAPTRQRRVKNAT